MYKPFATLAIVALFAGSAAADAPPPEAAPVVSSEEGPLTAGGEGVAADAPGARWLVSVDYILWWLR